MPGKTSGRLQWEKFAPRYVLLLVLLFVSSTDALALTCNSQSGGTWNTVARWSCGRVPQAVDDVFVLNGHTVTIDIAAVAQNVTVNNGGVLRFATGTARSLTINNAGAQGNLTIVAGGTLDVDAASNVSHTLSLAGDLANAGTLNLAPDANSLCNTTFNRNGNQTLSGAGGTSRFNLLTVNMGATENNILDVTATNFAFAATGYLTITNGTFRLSTAGTFAPFNADPAMPNGSNGKVIPANGRFWINNAGATVNVSTTGTDYNLTFDGGTMQMTSGILNIGDAADTRLRFTDTAGSAFVMDGGAINISGRWTSVNETDTVSYTQSGGTLTVGTVGNSLATFGPFFLGSGGSSFTMSGGNIVIVRASTAAADEYDNRATTSNVTGGTVQIGNAATPAGTTMQVSSVPPVWDFVVNNTNSPTAALDLALTVRDDVTINTGGTLTTNNLAISVGAGNAGGNWTNNGTFNAGTGTVTFTGTDATPAIGGTSATTFNNFIINKASNNLTINTTPTINGVLTLTSGDIVTGANRVILGTAATVATPSAASYVVGTVQKNYAAAGTFVFPVGDTSNYTPVTIQGTAGFTAGNLAISTTGTDHPQVTTPIATTGIDANLSVNRFWTLTGTGLPATSTYNATFNFINAIPVDRDAGTTQANFIVQRYDGANWNPTTLGTAGASSTSITGVVNAYGAFAIGEPLASFNGSPGAFNAFETTTPAGSILGRLFTERLGAGTFAVSIVAISNNAVNAAPSTAALTVAIIDASPTSGTLTAASNCRTSWTTVIQTQTVPAAVAWVSGRITVNITAPTRAVRNARIRVTQGALVGCSTDNFAIRPQALTITSSATQNNSSGGPAITTGANFTLTATAGVVGYDGTPVIDNTKITGTPNAGTIGGSFGAATGVTSAATGGSFYYNEVGNIGLLANAVFDSGFTSVDQPNDCTADFSNTLVGGKYGCLLGSTAITQTTGVSGFGRFIPANFAVSLNIPELDTDCGTFTYLGRAIPYATAPVITVTARSGTNNGLTNSTTLNYAGAYTKFSNVAGTSLNQTPFNTRDLRYTRFDALGGTTPTLDLTALPATTADPAIGTVLFPNSGQFIDGEGILTFSAGGGINFDRGTPVIPFNADISLALNVVDGDGVAYASNPARFGTATAGNGIAFSTAKEMRFGRMRLANAFGSALVDLRIPLTTEFYNSSGAFALNTADNCTTLSGNNISMTFTGGSNLIACETAISPPGSFTLSGGSAPALTLLKPGNGNDGPVDLRVNLGPASGNVCTAVGAGPGAAATSAALTYLRGNWTGAAYDQDPGARAVFGLYKGAQEFIYLQENF